MWSVGTLDNLLLSLGGRDVEGVGGKGKLENCMLAVSEAGLNEDRLLCRGEGSSHGSSEVHEESLGGGLTLIRCPCKEPCELTNAISSRVERGRWSVSI